MAGKWHFSLVVVYLVLGLLLATAYSSEEKARLLSQTPKKQELIAKIGKLEKARDEEKEKISRLRQSLSERESRAAANVGVLESYKAGLNLLKFETGLTGAKGPGIKVTLGDNPKPPDGDPNNYIIHDYDLRHVVNALWQGGAEAISINDQRLVSTSAIRCAGNTILVNSTRMASPFVVSAIGDPEKMERSLAKVKEADDLIEKIAKAFGLVASVEKFDSLKLPPYEGSVYFNESTVKEGGR